jgi:hypothetical protein
MILFALSAALLLLTAAAIVRLFPSEPGLRFWVFLAACSLQLTGLHLATSLFHALTPAGFLIAQAIGLVFAVLLRLRRKPAAPFPRPLLTILRSPAWRSPVCIVLILTILGALALSLTEQMLRPVTGFDERMYNCSRVLYWIQHRHIWPWTTHNDAQIDFPIGSEVFFSWPILFTRTEWVARLVFWLGYPAAIAGTYILARSLNASRAGSLGAAAAFAFTPCILLASGINQKQDIWTAAMFLGTASFLLRTWRAGGALNAGMLVTFFILTVNVKITCLAIAPLILLALVIGARRDPSPRRLGAAALAATLGTLLCSGLAATMMSNYQRYRHPLGAPAAAKVVAPDWSARQVYTHAVRAPLTLLELPAYPTEGFRRAWTDAGNELLYRLDAHRALPGERRGAWPGWFRFDAGPSPADPRAYRFSLGGIVWLIGMTCAAWIGARWMLAPRRRPLPEGALILLLSGLQLAALVFLLRSVWGAPERYWVAPYAAGLVGAISCLDRWARRAALGLPLVAALVYLVYPSADSALTRLRNLRAEPITSARTDEPFVEVMSKLPPGSSILFFGNRNARDYPLFHPRQDYPNKVIPWGRARFDSERLERLTTEHNITHAVFEAEDRLGFHWYPGLRVTWMVEWFRTRPNFREVPLETPRQRLFERVQ